MRAYTWDQSYDVVVRNCTARHNVAGIEIENCVNADVYNNTATENTGGILVFDLPELPLKRGRNIKGTPQRVLQNNHKNFAPKGNIVGQVPRYGHHDSGFGKRGGVRNQIIQNRTAGVSVISFYLSERPYNDAQYNPFSYNVYIHHNTIEKAKKGPSKQTRIRFVVGQIRQKRTRHSVRRHRGSETYTRAAAPTAKTACALWTIPWKRLPTWTPVTASRA